MVEVNTNISIGYLSLIEIFIKANNLIVKLGPVDNSPSRLKVFYDENSDTAIQITFMSLRHCGFENMLCDYLIRCGIEPPMIPHGKFVMRRSEKEMEEEWQKHRKTIGLY